MPPARTSITALSTGRGRVDVFDHDALKCANRVIDDRTDRLLARSVLARGKESLPQFKSTTNHRPWAVGKDYQCGERDGGPAVRRPILQRSWQDGPFRSNGNR